MTKNRRGATATATPAPRRSDHTRAAILNAARNRFAAEGYDRATIRAIAADARIDPSMVMRYYGSKEALFAAAVAVTLEVPDLTKVPRSKLGVTFARKLITHWEMGTNEAELTLIRSALSHPRGVARLQEVVDNQVRAAFVDVIGDDPDFDVRMALLVAQGVGTAVSRYVIGLEPVASLDPERLIEALGASAQRILTAPLPSGARAGRA